MALKIYKLEDKDVWKKAMNAGEYTGAPVDLADGFIHFSTASQSRETAAKHFTGRENLILAEIDAVSLGENLKWEVSRGGAKFPHLYGVLAKTSVNSTVDLPIGADGAHQFPDDFGIDES